MKKETLQEFLDLGPCSEAEAFVRKHVRKSPQKVWELCENGSWMLWLCGRTCGDDRRQLVLAACACARLALVHVKTGEDRPLKAIETAEKWAKGDTSITLADVHKAAYAAYAAYAAAYAADAAYADAAYAAYAAAAYADAYAAAYAAACAAAYAAAYADAAYADAAYADARKETLKKCAEIVRQFFPKCPIQ